jgi:hypothetical protein
MTFERLLGVLRTSIIARFLRAVKFGACPGGLCGYLGSSVRGNVGKAYDFDFLFFARKYRSTLEPTHLHQTANNWHDFCFFCGLLESALKCRMRVDRVG